jgi:hypothetical protein
MPASMSGEYQCRLNGTLDERLYKKPAFPSDIPGSR